MGYVYYKSLYRALGALGQDTIKLIKIINQSTHFINELLYMYYLTEAGRAIDCICRMR